jgi:enoyl-CoA hydratase
MASHEDEEAGMAARVHYRQDGPIAHITLDDGKLNVMSAGMLKEIHAALDRAERDKAIVVLSGREGVFSAGFDLKTFAAGSADVIYEMMKLGAELAFRVLTFPTPVVAGCTGHAFPMGAFLLMACDIRVGADGPFRLGLNEVTINIPVPSFGLELARQRLVPSFFQRTALTGEMFSPVDAVAAGLLDRVVPKEALAGTTKEIAVALTKIDLASHATTKARARRPAIAAVRAAIDAEVTLAAYSVRAPRRILLPGAAQGATP